MQLNFGADQANRWRKNLKRERRPRMPRLTRNATMWALIVTAITISTTLLALKAGRHIH